MENITMFFIQKLQTWNIIATLVTKHKFAKWRMENVLRVLLVELHNFIQSGENT